MLKFGESFNTMNTFPASRRMALWIDHAKAHFIDPDQPMIPIQSVHSDLEPRPRTRGESPEGVRLGGYRSTNNEHHRNNKEEAALRDYYRLLADRLEVYPEIYIFGPGEAHKELNNLLLEDSRFRKHRIETEACVPLSENQLRAKVREHFSSVVS